MRANLSHNLRAQLCPAVEHRHDNAADFNLLVRARVAHLLDHAHNFHQSFEREIFALNRSQNLIRGGERIGHQNPKRGRTIQQNKIERLIRTQDRQCLFEAREVIVHARDLHFRAGEVEIGRNEKQTLQAGRKNSFDDRCAAEQRLVKALAFELLHAERAGRVALWIKIDNQNALATLGQRAPEIDRRSGLAHAAFLICDCDDFHVRRTMNASSLGGKFVSARRRNQHARSEPDWHCVRSPEFAIAMIFIRAGQSACAVRKCDGHRAHTRASGPDRATSRSLPAHPISLASVGKFREKDSSPGR